MTMRDRVKRSVVVAIMMAAAMQGRTGRADSSAQDDASAIMQKVYRATTDGRRSSYLQMKIADSSGRERDRTMVTRSMRVGDVRKNFVLIDSPADARGAGFVTLDYDDTKKDGERWLYLPSVGRSTRIANTQLSGAFMGSDFSYGELSQPNPSLFVFTLENPSVVVDGEECWLIHGKPSSADAEHQYGYTGFEVWVSKSKLATVRIRAQLSEGRRTKYIRASDFKLVGRQWMAHKVEARTVQGEKLISKTVLVTLKATNDDANVTEEDFTKRRLEQGM